MGLVRSLLLLLGLWAAARPAIAADDEALARRWFELGRAALSTGRFAEARDLFRQSLEKVPKAGSAFNLAVALRGTGESKAAVAILDRLLAGELGPLQKAQQQEAEALRRQTQAEIGVIALRAPALPDLKLRLDGIAVTLGADGVIPVDAGPHRLEASASGHHPGELRVEVERGGRAEVTLTLEPIKRPTTGTLIVEADPEDLVRVIGAGEGKGGLQQDLGPGRYRLEADGPSGLRAIEAEVIAGETVRVRLQPEPKSVLESPWLWIGVGVVVVAAVVVSGVALSSGPEPIRDPVYDVIQTLNVQR